MKNIIMLGIVLGWATWFFRYEPLDQTLVLDRVTGELVLKEIVFPAEDSESFLEQ